MGTQAVFWFTLSLLTSACTGAVLGTSVQDVEPPSKDTSRSNGGAGGNANGTGAASVVGGAAGTSDAPPLLPGQPTNDGVVGHMRRLSTTEYRNTVVDLLGLADFNLGPTDSFLPDGRNGLFINNLNLPASVAIAANYQAAAESFADERVRYHFDVLSTCDFDKSEEACARQYIARVGKRALRRPLDSNEIEEFYVLFKSIRSAPGGSYKDGVRVVLEALLQTHEFLYHFETGDAAEQKGGKVPLTDYELASRLSYVFWSSMPDEALFKAADLGELKSISGLSSQVERMMAMPRSRVGLMRFFKEWLNFENTIELFNNSLYGDARDAVGQEPSLFIQSVVFEGDAKLSTLLSASYSFLNAPLAAIYRVSGVSGSNMIRHDLNPAERSGLLTMPFFLANTSFADGTIRPVIRGKYIRQRLLCQEMPPPPPEANTMAPKVADGASIRQRFTQHAANAFCAGCHRLLDPLGLVFDRYEATGVYRKLDPTNPGPDGNDNEGEVVGSDVDGKVVGAPALAQRLAGSKDVAACVAVTWFRYALGRSGEDKGDEPSIDALVASFSRDGDMKRLFRELVLSDAFRFLDVPTKVTRP
jgi:hypothetical protein